MGATLGTARWIGVAVLAFGIAWPPRSAQADDQQVRATIAALKRMGATVETDTTPDGLIRVSEVAFSTTDPTNAELVRLESLKDLSILQIHGEKFSDDGLSHLRG